MTLLPGLEYHVHENGIQEYIFLEATYEAVDQWMETAIELARPFAVNDIIRYVIVLPDGEMLPLMHTLKRIQEAIAARPARPSSRVAILHPPESLIPVLDAFVKLLHSGDKDVVRFFRDADREVAIRWLLER